MACNTTHNQKQINFSSFGEATAYICAGPKKQKFLFHKGLLCHLAPYFKAALEGGFKEAENAVIDLPDERPYFIRRFQLWAYTGQVLEADESIEDTNWLDLVWLYIFADKYDLPDLQNAIIDTMVAKRNVVKKFPTPCFPVIYDNTDAASPLRRLLIDWTAQKADLAHSIPAGHLDGNLDRNPPTFLLDLALALYKLRKGITKTHNWKELGCTFHVHPSVSTESRQGLPNSRRQSPDVWSDSEAVEYDLDVASMH